MMDCRRSFANTPAKPASATWNAKLVPFVRKIATLITESKPIKTVVDGAAVREYLGRPHFIVTEEILRRTAVPGVATGLAWTAVGGEILFIEATSMPGGRGFTVTGSIGKVMQESAQAALSYVRSRSENWASTRTFRKNDIHCIFRPVHSPKTVHPLESPSQPHWFPLPQTGWSVQKLA